MNTMNDNFSKKAISYQRKIEKAIAPIIREMLQDGLSFQNVNFVVSWATYSCAYENSETYSKQKK